jgi:putative ABC transport system permease protein
MLHNLWQDARYGVRLLASNRGFTLVAVLTLALGIGANTAIFTIVNAILLKPLPFPAPDRIVVLTERNPEKERRIGAASPRNIEDWERQSQTVEEFGAWRDWRFTMLTPEGPTLLSSAIASPALFRALGVTPIAGRLFLSEENQPGRDHVVMISHSFWQSQFAGDPNVEGKSIVLDNQNFTIVGVLPPQLEALWLGGFKIWAPLSVDPDQFLERHVRNRRVYARLRNDSTVEQAQAEMRTIAQRLEQQYPDANTGWTIGVSTLQENQVGDVRTPLLVFVAAVALVLLIACANVANLMLVRSASRRREFAIRSALGAGRWRVARQLLLESITLSLVGGVAGLLLAFWLVDLVIARGPNLIPQMTGIGLDRTVLTFTFLLSLLTGVLFGLLPALQSSRIDLVNELKEGQRGAISTRGFRLRDVLVVSQVALALVLLAGAGLLGRTFVRLLTMQPGFNPERLLTVQLFLPSDKYKSRDAVSAFYRRITEDFKMIPGVQAVGSVSAGPQFGGIETTEFLAEGQKASPNGEYPQARWFDASPGYFRTMEIPLLKGREFDERDGAGGPEVAVINETMERRFFPNESPVGKHLTLVHQKQTLEIVGVAGDVKRYGLGSQVEPEIYWPNLQQPRWASYFVFRTTGDPGAIASAIRGRVQSAGPAVQTVNVATMDQKIAASLREPGFNLLLVGFAAATALMLAGIGLYGVISYSVARRTHEIGIRMALGARSGDVLRLIIRRGMALVVAGVTLGLLVSFACTRFIRTLLFDVAESDPLTFVVVVLLLSSVALLACFVPARRATRVDPMIALRCE